MNTSELCERFIASRRAAHRAAATIEWYEYVLARWQRLAPTDPTTTTEDDIERFLTTAPSAESARNWLRAMRAFSAWAARRYGLPSPAHDVIPPRPKPRLPRVWTEGEIRLIAEAARADWRDQLAVHILLDTGIRIGELATIRAERVELTTNGGTPAYAITITGKDGARRVPLSRSTAQLIMRHAPASGPLFVHGPGAVPFTTAGLGYRLRELVARAGIVGPKIGAHTFRHTFATLYLRNGGDIYRLQRLLGHASITQTTVYLHLSDPDAFNEHARLSPVRLLTNTPQLPLTEPKEATG